MVCCFQFSLRNCAFLSICPNCHFEFGGRNLLSCNKSAIILSLLIKIAWLLELLTVFPFVFFTPQFLLYQPFTSLHFLPSSFHMPLTFTAVVLLMLVFHTGRTTNIMLLGHLMYVLKICFDFVLRMCWVFLFVWVRLWVDQNLNKKQLR